MNVERMKELKIMKTLRYLLIVIGLVSVLSIGAQTLAQKPEVKMTSTSTMVGSGSCLPQAAATGVYTTYETQKSNVHKSPGPRRALDGDDDVTVPDDNVDPDATPIGDAWPLALLACAYALMRAILINKRKKQQKHCSVR